MRTGLVPTTIASYKNAEGVNLEDFIADVRDITKGHKIVRVEVEYLTERELPYYFVDSDE